MCKCRSVSFLSIIEDRGWGYPHKIGIYVSPYRPRLNKKKGGGAYGAEKTEKKKIGCFQS